MKLFLVALLVAGLIPSGGTGQEKERPHNIVMMIGDGMGISQVTAGRTYKGFLELEKFKHLGLVLTHGFQEHYVIESGAAATALSTGVLSFPGSIGVASDSSRIETLLELAVKKGKKTGVVTVCSITHATPASYVAHVPSRTMQLEIALQISESDADLFLGSGWGWFLPASDGGRRTDGKDLLQRMKERGFTYVSEEGQFTSLDVRRQKKVFGMFAENHVGPAPDRKPALQDMTQKALEFLSNSGKGFFLLVEGSQIDWAGHDNKSDQIMIEMADFDDAIGTVLRFAEKNPKTLVVVTADHETGGYGLLGGSLSEKTVKGGFLTGNHTAAMVPLFAMGPGAELLTGIQSSADVGKKLLELWK